MNISRRPLRGSLQGQSNQRSAAFPIRTSGGCGQATRDLYWKPLLLILTILAGVVWAQSSLGAENREAVVERVGNDIQYLASKELEGRGVETEGIKLAADFILSEYKKHGLLPALPDESYKQAFRVPLGKTQVVNETELTAEHTDGTKLQLTVGKDFQPLQRGLNGTGGGELVFVGYGISSSNEQYDDYANTDVAGKVIVMIRREPQQDRADGAFLGKETSSHSFIDRKLELAAKHGAAGIVFVNDRFTAPTPDRDELTGPSGFGTTECGIPFVHVKQRVIDQILAVSPLMIKDDSGERQLQTLEQVCNHIDETMSPVSQPVTGWNVKLTTRFSNDGVEAFNLIGTLEAEGDLADETIVVGAHYDHLGYGGYGSRAKNRTGEIHYGADDNATGTAAVLEMIRRITSGPKLKRRIVFICFSGEERGLLGSKHYISNPVYPLDKTVAMLNYDMIGTLRNNRVEVNGVGTAREFRPIVEAADEASTLEIRIIDHPFAGSDHLPFFQKQIPVMFCFTGITSRYHTPDDTFEAINVPGTVDVIDYTESLLRGIDALRQAPRFQPVTRNRRSPRIPYLGIVPNLSADREQTGVPIQTVRQGSPAEAAGLQVSDVIVKANDTEIGVYSDLIQVIAAAAPGDALNLTIVRDEEETQLTATLGTPR